MQIVMPLFDFENSDWQEYVFGGGKYRLCQFDASAEIPDTQLFSTIDREHMEDYASWAIVAHNAEIETYKAEVNILLLCFKIYTLSRTFIKYHLCKEDSELCLRLNDTMQYILPEKSSPLIRHADFAVIDKGFSNLLQMDRISNRTHNAIYFFYRGWHSTKIIDSILFFMVGIECLFSNEKPRGQTKMICKRVSKFLGEKDRCRWEDISELYTLRSKITHGQFAVDTDIKGNKKTAHELEYVVTECMKKMLDEGIYTKYTDVATKETYLDSLGETAPAAAH